MENGQRKKFPFLIIAHLSSNESLLHFVIRRDCFSLTAKNGDRLEKAIHLSERQEKERKRNAAFHEIAFFSYLVGPIAHRQTDSEEQEFGVRRRRQSVKTFFRSDEKVLFPHKSLWLLCPDDDEEKGHKDNAFFLSFSVTLNPFRTHPDFVWPLLSYILLRDKIYKKGEEIIFPSFFPLF